MALRVLRAALRPYVVPHHKVAQQYKITVGEGRHVTGETTLPLLWLNQLLIIRQPEENVSP